MTALTETTRLHFGCGDKILAGWCNADAKKGEGVDLVVDFHGGLWQLKPESLDWIYTSHVLEHLFPSKLPGVLAKLYESLKPGGKLTVASIDIGGIWAHCIQSPDYTTHWEWPLFGKVDAYDQPWDAHRNAFTWPKLRGLLQHAGFDVVRKWTPTEYPEIAALKDYSSTAEIISVMAEGIKQGTRGLVYDLGFHLGNDTAAYLAAGYRVVAVEAHPGLAEKGRGRFAREIDEGRLTLLETGVGNRKGTLPFYAVKSRGPAPEWSSFIEANARHWGEVDILQIPMVPFREILQAHGCPEYLKIDVEGADEWVLEELEATDLRPKFLSAENGGQRMLDALSRMGYGAFKWIDQRPHGGASGPWGEDAPGPWMSATEVGAIMKAYYDSGQNREPSKYGWYDLHARHG